MTSYVVVPEIVESGCDGCVYAHEGSRSLPDCPVDNGPHEGDLCHLPGSATTYGIMVEATAENIERSLLWRTKHRIGVE